VVARIDRDPCRAVRRRCDRRAGPQGRRHGDGETCIDRIVETD